MAPLAFFEEISDHIFFFRNPNGSRRDYQLVFINK